MRTPVSASTVSVLLLIAGNGVTAVLAAAVLDALVVRPPEPAASITTLLPGFVYACATVMKVCLVAGLLFLAIILARWITRQLRGTALDTALVRFPAWGGASVALAPAATLVGAFVAIGYQRVSIQTAGATATQLQHAAQIAVFSMLATLFAGAVAAAISLVRREGTAEIPVLGLAVNAVLIGLFCSLKFYALGFDQDTWAPR